MIRKNDLLYPRLVERKRIFNLYTMYIMNMKKSIEECYVRIEQLKLHSKKVQEINIPYQLKGIQEYQEKISEYKEFIKNFQKII